MFLVFMGSQLLLTMVLLVHLSTYLIRIECVVSFKLLCHGCIGPGAMLTDLDLCAKMLFTVISFMTLIFCLRLHYVYEKLPKKCCKLLDLNGDLKEVFKLSKGGNLPVQAHGSGWITYKYEALQRVVDQYRVHLGTNQSTVQIGNT